MMAVREAVTIGPNDGFVLDLRDSGATHIVALFTPTGALQIEPVERVNQVLTEWRRRPGATLTISVHLLDVGGANEAIEDENIVASIERCEPVMFVVKCEDAAELLPEALRDHLARLNLGRGRH
jgi:hypothetical protein